ncbi:hypothetical protein NNC19_15720 [Clostridium sp. SHJSY1]|uniref:cyclic-phosphate processing receiver domain-containing protein n=1 Tax=Clostridium sp. SHJSY1 TaxID=2942483 RepID=UPI002875F3D4|nr:cyclic-phosphate processing receiver domain-containing protein [Clostridium sp. SHJSY1]MDS0527139.1 hypothetical protein [Clostridium sp. SHJSY1]
MKKKINLYLDDLRDCPEDFVVARNMEQALYYLENDEYEVEILSLDHDLGIDGEGKLLSSGYDLVKYFCENGLRANSIYLHTDNPVGRDNMYYTLLAAKRRRFINSISVYPYPYVKNKYTEE